MKNPILVIDLTHCTELSRVSFTYHLQFFFHFLEGSILIREKLWFSTDLLYFFMCKCNTAYWIRWNDTMLCCILIEVSGIHTHTHTYTKLRLEKFFCCYFCIVTLIRLHYATRVDNDLIKIGFVFIWFDLFVVYLLMFVVFI